MLLFVFAFFCKCSDLYFVFNYQCCNGDGAIKTAPNKCACEITDARVILRMEKFLVLHIHTLINTPIFLDNPNCQDKHFRIPSLPPSIKVLNPPLGKNKQ